MNAAEVAFDACMGKRANVKISQHDQLMLKTVAEGMRNNSRDLRAEIAELRGMVRKLQLEVARLKGAA